MSKIFSIIFIIIFIIRDIILINANDINDTYINTSNIIYETKKI